MIKFCVAAMLAVSTIAASANSFNAVAQSAPTPEDFDDAAQAFYALAPNHMRFESEVANRVNATQLKSHPKHPCQTMLGGQNADKYNLVVIPFNKVEKIRSFDDGTMPYSWKIRLDGDFAFVYNVKNLQSRIDHALFLSFSTETMRGRALAELQKLQGMCAGVVNNFVQ